MSREYVWQKIEEPTEKGALFQGSVTQAVYLRDDERRSGHCMAGVVRVAQRVRALL